MKVKVGEWYEIYVCWHCENRVHKEELYNRVCPSCGALSKYEVKVKTLVVRKIKNIKTIFYIFKSVKITFEGKRDIDKEWLKQTK